ncbi:LuxR family transcriptional regulator [Gardnerella vaginalis]|uniref:LuxR family transcriptional regulator n=1 Tax=Gardnerella vaginalis TaxID=2702 RepID=A0A3E1IQ05_GARVA|nr:response regulator transcription factor [Gardnerella vaginalis]MBF9308543.1 response regulator [Bifidobacteriaceae bacterium NR043]MBF9353235.1 response regulator [Bifidobacteriaceae bacterium NR044]RFD74843.1 LuxR family transcriptional regulator [Gardnerella vaginalis]
MEYMENNEVIRVAIADDQELVRAGFAMVINSQQDMHVVSQASNGSQIVELSKSQNPDIILMDVRMPVMDGLEATRKILQQKTNTNTRIIILTTFDLDEYVMAAIHAGASGFLLKDTEPETLLNSIRTVYQGNAIIAPTATKRLIENMIQQGKVATNITANRAANYNAQENSATQANSTAQETQSCAYENSAIPELTDREREVLVEIAHGLSNQEIADKLFISLPTVKTHVAHILGKIGARDRVQAVVFAYENDLVKP